MYESIKNVPHLVVELNNKAIQSLSEGNADASVAALSSALSSLQLAQNMIVGTNESPINMQLSYALNLLQNMTMASSANNTPISSIELSHSCFEDRSGSFCVFNHVLTIPNALALDCDVSRNFERLQAMLLYNLGLTVHFQAMRSGRSEELRGALDLYEMSFSIVEKSWQLIDMADLMTLLMGLLNNMGHIHSNLFNMTQLQSCIDWLKGLAGHPAFLSIMQRDQYSRFSMNLLVVLNQVERQHCSPAA